MSARRWLSWDVLGAVALLAAAAAHPARALDPHSAPNWTFEVAAVVEAGPGEHVVKLRPSPPGIRYPRKCDTFVVHTRFVPGAGVTRDTRSLFTPDAHERAIRELRAAQLRGELVRVGSIDAGFGLIPERPECEVASRGLALMLDYDGHRAVYSVY